MTSHTPRQVVTMALSGLADPWRRRFDIVGKMLDTAAGSAAAIAECRQLLPLAEAEPRIKGILHLLLAQALIGRFNDEVSMDILIASIDEGYRAQKLIDRERDQHLWGLCEFNLGIAHETLAAGEQGDAAEQHLREAALHLDRACQVLPSALLAESLYRLGAVQMQIGIATSNSDAFSASRNSLSMAAKLYADMQQPRKEINALCKAADTNFRHGTQMNDLDAGIEALKILLPLVQRGDITPAEKLKVDSLLGRAVIFCSIPERNLQNLQDAAALLQRVAEAYQFDRDPWGWLTARFHLADACLKVVTWTMQWKADPAKLDILIDFLIATTDEALEKCDEKFPDHRRDLTGVKLAALSLRLIRSLPGDVVRTLAQLQAVTEELRTLQTTYPSTRHEGLARRETTILGLLSRGNWQGTIEEAAKLLRDVNPKALFLSSPGTMMEEMRRLASIGHMAAYACLMTSDDKGALNLSEASKSRFMQLAIATDLLSGEAAFGREFRAAREDWLRVDGLIKRLDHMISKAPAERLPELLNRKRALATDFGAISNRLDRMLEQIPSPAIPALEPASLAGTLPPDGVAISVIVTAAGGAGIVLRGPDFEPHGIRFPDLTSAAVQDLFAPRSMVGGWLEAYRRFRQASETAGSTITLQELSDWSDTVLSIGERLWALFLGPLHTHLTASGLASGSQVTLILPGVLGTLPISAAWRLEDGRRRFIIEDWTVSCAPGIHVLAAAQRHIWKERHQDATLLLVATEDEVLSPFRHTDAKTVSPQTAGIPRVLDALRSGCFPFWSFGCHGYWDADDSRRSRLIVSEDEMLTVADLQSQPLPSCRLALLGACESGVLDPSGALAEQIGIPSALVEAGVAGVIGTLWLIGGPVDDFLARVLDRHLKGESPAASLRAEQLALIARMQPSHAPKKPPAAIPASRYGAPVELQPAVETFDPALPAFWAAFQLTGM